MVLRCEGAAEEATSMRYRILAVAAALNAAGCFYQYLTGGGFSPYVWLGLAMAWITAAIDYAERVKR
jgi:hypothetical protein